MMLGARAFRRTVLLRAAAKSGAESETVGATAAAVRAARVEEIRRKETTLWWLRALVVPGFIVYGLVVLRPTEGHFLRYLAERRHLEPPFNQLFPPLTREQLRTGEGAAHPAQTSSTSSATTSTSVALDKTWLKKKFHIDVADEEDEARVARKRLLFARDRSFSESFSDEYGVVFVKPAEERQRELELLALHPPMHVLREQLDHLAAVSRTSHRRQSETPEAGASTVTAPPLELQFRDYALFASAAMVFHNAAGEEVKRMRFVGVCGMIWKQLT